MLMAHYRVAWSRTLSFQLPSSKWLPAVITLLSPLATMAIATGKLSDRNKTNDPNTLRARIILIVDQLHSIFLTAIATIALTYIFPENVLSCHLDQQWQSLFQQKNAQSIRTIQDSFQCCGLRSIHDRAWPFKDRNHGDNACELQFGYHQSCFIPWSEQQQTTSWLVFAAAFLSWVAKVKSLSSLDLCVVIEISNEIDNKRLSRPKSRTVKVVGWTWLSLVPEVIIGELRTQICRMKRMPVMVRVRLVTEELFYLILTKVKLKPDEPHPLVLVKNILMHGRRSEYVGFKEAYL